MKKEEYDQILTERLISIQHSLWNSLITLNGLIIATTSIIFSLDISIPVYLILIILASTFLCIFLILFNYIVIKNVYHDIYGFYDRYEKYQGSDRDKKIESEFEKLIKKHNWINYREKFSIGLTLINVFAVLVIIAITPKGC